VHYLEWGMTGMPAVVCVHGYTGSAQAFNGLARHLRDSCRVLALDVRGHGESEWSATGAYEYSDQAGDLADFVDRLELPRFALIGAATTAIGGSPARADSYTAIEESTAQGRRSQVDHL
jgi:pimeloyl-ACP methyl ester carboxylesterase